MNKVLPQQRRDFLKKLTGTLAGGSALAMFPQLRLIESALAAERQGGSYRALVCVYLGGGNDSFNWLVPTDSARYSIYNTARGGTYLGATGPLAIDVSALRPITLNGSPSGHSYGLHPACADWTAVDRNGLQTANMPGLQSLTNRGKIVWIANAGTLIVPTTKSNYQSPLTPKPPELYSHYDQANIWFQGQSTRNYNRGWGGRIADLLFAENLPIPGTGLSLPLTISLSGANVFQSGNDIQAYQMSNCGSVLGGAVVPGIGVGAGFADCSGTTMLNNFRACDATTLSPAESALCRLTAAPQVHPMSAEHAKIMRQSQSLSAELERLLASATASNASLLTTPFRALADDSAVPGVNESADLGNGLADQLAMVARLIKVRAGLGQNRNVFFVKLDGFDTHASQMTDSGQPRLLRKVSRALGAFYKALEELGMENNVTTFTVSEFARTLNSNGDGTDHAWGGVSLVMGGAVNNGGAAGTGGRLVGAFPDQTLNGADSFSRGQMIPSTSADSVSSTLASWMGVSQSNLTTIFPHLSNFPAASTPYNLGFMSAAPP
jgi:uncharacterized protein (DUF1501 family)